CAGAWERAHDDAVEWDKARPPRARRCPGWIPPGARTSAAPSGPAPPESPEACDSKLGPPPFSGFTIEAHDGGGLTDVAAGRPGARRRGRPKLPRVDFGEWGIWTSFGRIAPDEAA